MKKTILAVIPARRGSKGIIHKNIRMLSGKPLICHTIDAAQKSKLLTQIVVSTDDSAIADIAEKKGVDVLIRPKNLATDSAPMGPVIAHAALAMAAKGKKPDYVVTLQPTSPLRTSEDIDAAITLLLGTTGDSLLGVCQVDGACNPFWLKLIENGRVVPFIKTKKQIQRRQELPSVYRITGAMYITSYSLLVKKKSLLGSSVIPFIMDGEKAIDIDSELDFKIAELVIYDNSHRK